MRALILLLVLTATLPAETFHAWEPSPVTVNGKQRGHYAPFRTEFASLKASLRTSGHTVVEHNTVLEGHPSVSALPALTVLHEGAHVQVLAGHDASRLDARRASAANVRLAKARHLDSLAARHEAQASDLRIRAAETYVLADKLSERGHSAEATRKTSEAQEYESGATTEDGSAATRRTEAEAMRR